MAAVPSPRHCGVVSSTFGGRCCDLSVIARVSCSANATGWVMPNFLRVRHEFILGSYGVKDTSERGSAACLHRVRSSTHTHHTAQEHGFVSASSATSVAFVRPLPDGALIRCFIFLPLPVWRLGMVGVEDSKCGRVCERDFGQECGTWDGFWYFVTTSSYLIRRFPPKELLAVVSP